MRAAAFVTICAILSGCAFHQTPYVMYEGKVPLADTAVFSALDDLSPGQSDPRIISVDGKETACAQAGCPYWVRVVPGTHNFLVRYRTAFSLAGHWYADLHIEIKDMRPRRVYVARYTLRADKVSAKVEDLGENADYGIPLGPDNKRYKAAF